MATSDLRVNLYNKRLMTQEAYDLHFFRFLDNKVNDATRAAFLQSGVLDDKQIGLTSSTVDTFTVDLADADRGVDELGHIVDLGLVPASYIEDIPFENTIGTTYYVGFRYQSVPNDVERNPRSAEAEYPWFEDTVGDLGNPDTVTDGGTYIELRVNGILEAAVDHGTRVARVWLNNPVSPDDAIAYYEGTVLYTGGNNVIRIPYTPTAGPLGQTAPEYPISLTALDYSVFIPGVSWFKTKDLRTEPNYIFIGTVLGNGGTPTVFDLTDQRPVFMISLDRAYRANSLDDPAPGRTITADKGAVIIRQSATSQWEQDHGNQALVIDKLNETIAGGVGLATMFGAGANYGVPYAAVRNMGEPAGSELVVVEPVTMLSSTNTVQFTRVGVDLTVYTDRFFFDGGALCLISGTLNGIYDGVYWVSGGSVGVAQLNVTYPDGTVPTFPPGISGTAQILIYTWTHISTSFYALAHSDINCHSLNFTQGSNGVGIQCRGNPVDPSVQRALSFGHSAGGELNRWGSVYTGRIVMRGGNNFYVNSIRTDGAVVGWAQFQSDKRSITDLIGAYQPLEEGLEWGFDFRGTDFGKSSNDIPPFNIAGSFRVPFWHYEGGLDYVRTEEAFTRIGATILQMTRAGFDRSKIPAAASGDASNWVLAEVEFDTPNPEDGVYWVHDNGAPANFDFYRLDGTLPNFPVGTGKIRFYGGVFFGPIPQVDSVNTNKGYMAQIVVPTRFTGGLRLNHLGATAILSTEYRYLLAAYNDENLVFGLRDGGQTYARSLTTRAPRAGHGLTQWDQVSTGLITSDLGMINVVDLDETNRYIRTGTNPASNMNIVKPNGANYTSCTRPVNVFRGISTLNSSNHVWWKPTPDASSAYMKSTGALVSEYGYYVIPFTVPEGATITSITLYVDPEIGDGTTASMGYKATRRGYTSTTVTDLTASGFHMCSSAGLHTETYTPTVNNVVDNGLYQYDIHIRSSYNAVSAAVNDYLYSIRVVFTMPGIGECWFDVV